MDRSEVRSFLEGNHRAVLATHRSDGGIQMSPITVAIDDAERVVISSRETAFKVKNLRADPRATVCIFTDRFFGPWVFVEGEAEIVTLPEAMDLLIDYYRRAAGEHDDWDEYRDAMERDRRLVIRIPIERWGPTKKG